MVSKRYAKLVEGGRPQEEETRLHADDGQEERHKAQVSRRAEAPRGHPLRAARVRGKGGERSRVSDSSVSRGC